MGDGVKNGCHFLIAAHGFFSSDIAFVSMEVAMKRVGVRASKSRNMTGDN
ncbi:hypothetical protein TUM12370_35350 [Salmonella enterica subsp. enterica serovar Choleraesuis]|nr:hypothetical protein TUM12370_35350 [Salmonella enterica subsp. enterica serovar Choleraesuis]